MQVYLITNTITGKQYVGQTVKALLTRWSEHKSPASTTRFSRSVIKHGPENFTMEMLHMCETKEEMDFVEMFYIVLLNTKTPNGYNITDGGEGTTGVVPSAETREKMRVAKLGKKQTPEHISSRNKIGRKHAPHSEETKEKLRIKLTGATNANFGKPHSELHKQRIRESNLKSKPWHHGTGTAYCKYKCRCEVCIGENSWYSRMVSKARRLMHGKYKSSTERWPRTKLRRSKRCLRRHTIPTHHLRSKRWIRKSGRIGSRKTFTTSSY